MARLSGWRRVAIGVATLAVVAAGSAWIVARRLIVEYRASPRLGEVGAPPSSFSGATTRLNLANSTRAALGVRSGADGVSTIDVAADPATKFVAFSIGVDGATAKMAGNVRFTISAAMPNGLETIFEQELPSTTTEWRDQVVPVPPLDAAFSVLRFEITNPRRAGGGLVGPHGVWGSVRTIVEKRGMPVLREHWEKGEGRARPTIVLMSLDTLGAKHLSGFGGGPDVSPRLQRFLAEGASFRRAYSHYPNTLVSHASLFTSLYPKHHGVYDQTPYLDKDTLAEFLTQRGYLSIAVTEDGYIAAGFGFDRGFDRYDNGPAPDADHFVGDARETFANALEAVRRVPDEVPVFVFAHTYETHTPYIIRDDQAGAIADALTPGYRGRYTEGFYNVLELFSINQGDRTIDDADVARLRALYAGEINYLDRAFATFLDELEKLRPAQDLLVVVTSDHGEEFLEHGSLGHGETLFAPALHVPLGFVWPGHVERRTTDVPVGLVDVVPTILELLGDRPRPGLDGESLVTLMRGGREPARPQFAEQETRWSSCALQGQSPPCRVNGLSVRTAKFTFVSSDVPAAETLYDAINDPDEMVDVSGQHPDALEAHRELAHVYQGYAAGGADASEAIDDATRARLRALGYMR